MQKKVVLMERRGQGSLEYLLILGAVLAIAAIVVYIILGYTSKTEEVLSTQCQNAMKECKYKKASLAKGSGNFTVCALTCKACYELDVYINQTRGGPHPGPAWEAIVKNASDNTWLKTNINKSTNYYDCIHQSPF